MVQPITTDDIVQDILTQGRVSNPHINFAHGMMHAAGFNAEGNPQITGPGALPSREEFAAAGVATPEPTPEAAPGAEAEETPERSLLERAGRLGVMVLRAPVDVAGSTIDQLDRLRAVAMQKIGDTFGPAMQQAIGAVGSLAPDPAEPTGGTMLGFGEDIERLTNHVLAQPETGVERGVSDVARFLVAMTPAVKGLKVAGMGATAAATTGGATAEFFALDPDNPTVLEAVGHFSPEVQEFVKTYIKSDASDDDAEAQLRAELSNSGFRAMFDGVILGALFEAGMGTWRLLRQGFKSKQVTTEGAQQLLQEAPIGPGGRVSRGRQLGPGFRDLPERPVVEVSPEGVASIVRDAPSIRLARDVTPAQVTEQLFTSMQRGTRGGIGASREQLGQAMQRAAEALGKDPSEMAELFRLGNGLLGASRGRFRAGIRVEGTAGRESLFRQAFGAQESARTLAGLAGLVGAGGAAALLGFPDTEEETSRVLEEAGILGTVAKGLARRLHALAGGLETAAERGAVRRQTAAGGGRQLVHTAPVVTDAAEEAATEPAASAARELITEQPVRIARQGVRKDIHFDKIDTDGDVQDLLAQMSDAFEPQISAARRLGTSQAGEAELARNMGMTVEDLHQFAGVAQVLPKVAVAANEMLVASAKRLEGLRKAVIDGGNPDAEHEFLKQVLIHGKIQRSVGGIRAEAGRTLGMYKLDRAGNIDLLPSMADDARRLGAKSRTSVRQMAELMGTLTPAQQSKMARDMTKPNASGALLEYWMNSILSGPKTMITNLGGSVLGMMMAPSERFVTAQFAKRLGGDAVAGEATAMAYGMADAVTDALQLFSKTFKSGVPTAPGTRMEFVRTPQFTAEAFNVDPNTPAGAFVNGLGHFIRTPGRLLMATDDAAKLVLYRGELRAQALREARRQSVPAGQLETFIGQFMTDPPEQALAQALRTRDVFTFTNSLSDPNASFQSIRAIGQSLSMASQKAPVLKLLIPFIKTPVNLATFSAERSPVINLLSSTFRAQLGSGNPNVRAEALTKLTMSGGVMASVAALSASGLITGRGPHDKALRKRLQDQGMEFNAVKIGDRWVKYDRADPLGMMFGVAADIASVIGIAKEAGLPERDLNQVVTTGVLSFAHAFTSKTYMQSIARTLDAIRGGGFGEQKLDALTRIAVDTVASGAVPNILAEIRRTVDPNRREMETILSRFMNRIPGLSDNLPAKTNDWGEPVLYGYGMGEGVIAGTWNFLAPFAASKIKHHPVAELLADNDIPYHGPSKRFRGVELTEQELNDYKKLVADHFLPQAERLANLPSWGRLTPGPDGGRAMALGRIRNAAVRRAQLELMRNRKFISLQQKVREANRGNRFVQPAATSRPAVQSEAVERLIEQNR